MVDKVLLNKKSLKIYKSIVKGDKILSPFSFTMIHLKNWIYGILYKRDRKKDMEDSNGKL